MSDDQELEIILPVFSSNHVHPLARSAGILLFQEIVSRQVGHSLLDLEDGDVPHQQEEGRPGGGADLADTTPANSLLLRQREGGGEELGGEVRVHGLHHGMTRPLHTAGDYLGLSDNLDLISVIVDCLVFVSVVLIGKSHWNLIVVSVLADDGEKKQETYSTKTSFLIIFGQHFHLNVIFMSVSPCCK